MTNGPEEPSADARLAAGAMRQMFVALQLEGFSERQAVALIGQVLAAHLAAGSNE